MSLDPRNILVIDFGQLGDVIMSLSQPFGGHSSNRNDGPAGVRGLKIVDIPFSLTGGGPGISTRTYSFFIYVEGLRYNDPGYASALAYLGLVLVLVVATIYFARTSAAYPEVSTRPAIT